MIINNLEHPILSEVGATKRWALEIPLRPSSILLRSSMHDDDILISESKVGNTLAINIDAKSMQFRSLKMSSSAGASSFEHIMP